MHCAASLVIKYKNTPWFPASYDLFKTDILEFHVPRCSWHSKFSFMCPASCWPTYWRHKTSQDTCPQGPQGWTVAAGCWVALGRLLWHVVACCFCSWLESLEWIAFHTRWIMMNCDYNRAMTWYRLESSRMTGAGLWVRILLAVLTLFRCVLYRFVLIIY